MAYIRRHGSLHLGRRIEAAGGTIAAAVYGAAGARDVSPYDFMPHANKPTATRADILKLFRGN